MWPFFNKQKQSSDVTEGHAGPRTRPMKFSQLLDGMGDFSDLAKHDTAMKFWLPEPALEALKEISTLNGDSVSEALRQFFAIKQHLFCKFRFWFWGCCAVASGQGFMFR